MTSLDRQFERYCTGSAEAVWLMGAPRRRANKSDKHTG
jgi:hypothetical protein